MISYKHLKEYSLKHFWIISFFLLIHSFLSLADEKILVRLRDFSKTELKSGGFTLPSDTKIHIEALGGGCDKSFSFDKTNMYAYGWIIDADTREMVWKMDCEYLTRRKDDLEFNDKIMLKQGSYEVYFTAYAFAKKSRISSFNTNIDHRKSNAIRDSWRKKGFFSWLEDFFGEDFNEEWNRRSKKWGIDIGIDSKVDNTSTFNSPKGFTNVLFKAIELGENEHIKQGFIVKKQMPVRIYTLGEMSGINNLADYGWIIDAKTRKRIWEVKRRRSHTAGGEKKNFKYDDVVEFSPGEYILYYITDDSHSFVDWNAAPPYDPFNYGITLTSVDEKMKSEFELSTVKENKNIIIDITKVGDDQTQSVSFSLNAETILRVYAVGERSNLKRQMADYGWIINSKTREKIWTMDAARTEHAGGAEKNRLIDEVITLPKGTYTVFYQTDDSHSYNDWNASPPFDPENWGITISGEGEQFKMSNVEKNIVAKEIGVIAQIVRVGDDANRNEYFKLLKQIKIRIYAIGEGQNREMYDFGWIENVSTGQIIWEMTYSMTFHAGGGRKNRMVNTTLLLDKGEYKLHYKSDDSHSFNDWNTDPPDDPTMWGITIYKEK